MVKLVLCDIDDTLSTARDASATPRALAAIKALQAEGVEFGVSTGRVPAVMPRFFGDASECWQTGIYTNGKQVLLDGEKIYESHVPKEPLMHVVELIDQIPGAFLFVNPKIEDSNQGRFVGVHMDEATAERASELTHVSVKANWDMPPEVLTGCLMYLPGDAEEYARHRAWLEPQTELAIRPAYFNFFDVLPSDVNKATGLAILLERMGITPEEVMVFGDSENDLEIMRVVGHPVAVANASPECKEAARWHVGPCHEDGVAIALEQLVEALRTGGIAEFMR